MTRSLDLIRDLYLSCADVDPFIKSPHAVSSARVDYPSTDGPRETPDNLAESTTQLPSYDELKAEANLSEIREWFDND